MGTGANVERLHVRLFLEGIEVPIIAATVNCSMNSPVSAQFELVPTDAALRFKPRTTVHAFFLDTGDPNYIPDTKTGLLPIGPDVYKLLFCGEVFDIVFSKSGAGSRSIVLNCLDFSSLLDTTYIYLLRLATGSDAPGGRTVVSGSQAVFLGAPELLDDTDLNSPQQLIARLASQRKNASSPGLSDVKDNIGGLLAALELIGGIPGATLGLYDWQTVQERRVRLMDQIGTDSGRTAAKIFDQSVLEEWLVNNLGQSGDYISFREITEQIMSYVYYGVAPQSVGIYRNGTRAVAKFDMPAPPPVSPQSAGGTTKLANVDPDMITAHAFLLQILAAKGWGVGAKPSVTIASATGGKHSTNSYHYYGLALDLGITGYPLGGFVFADGRIATPLGSLSRALANPKSVTPWNWARRLAAENNITDKAALEEALDLYGKDYGYYGRLKEDWLTTVQFFLDLRDAVKEFNSKNIPSTSPRATKPTIQIKWGGEFVSSTPDPALSLYGLSGDIVHIELSPPHARTVKAGVAGAPGATPQVSGGDDSGGALSPAESVAFATPSAESTVANLPRQKLYTQIFRPDCWFVAPPICNVIFPEEYTSFSFRRQMMREITRLELDTFNIMINEALLRTVYFAPRIKGFEGLETSGTTANKRVVYPHERFSGVIPKTEQMPDLPFYAKKEIVEQVSEVATPTDIRRDRVDAFAVRDAYEGEATNLIEKFASRAVTFHFLSYRYAARSMSVSGRFMPRLVLGFPGVVIDKPKTAVENRPVHHLGMVTSIQHSLNQTGGFTFVSYSHARSHRTSKNEIDDLFAEYDGGTVFEIQDEVISGVFDVGYTDGTPLSPDEYPEWQIKADSWITTQIRNLARINEAIRLRNEVYQQISEESLPPDFNIELPTSIPGIEVIDPQQQSELEPVTVWNESALRGSGLVGPNGKRLVRLALQGNAPTATLVLEEVDSDGNPVLSDEATQIFTQVEGVPDPVRTYNRISFDEATRDEVPLEDSIRPPWFDEEYSNSQIDTLYKKLFGCTSVLRGNASVEEAVDALVSQYSAAALAEGRALTSAIDIMTRRDMASLNQVLLMQGDPSDQMKPEAFHYYTVGNWKNFEGLLLRDVVDEFGNKVTLRTALLGTPSSGQERDIFSTTEVEYLDVRRDRRQAVVTYMSELFSKRGLRG